MRALYKVWSSALNGDQITRIMNTAFQQPAEDATVFSSDESMQGIRSCTIRWLKDEWTQTLLWSYVEKANVQGFDVSVQNRAEMQFIEYSSERDDAYEWHHDVQWYGQSAYDRKLSVTVQLTHPSTYVGGEFQFEEVDTNADFLSQGTILVFPSYLRHRIRPIISGRRHALVAWFYGPRWA